MYFFVWDKSEHVYHCESVFLFFLLCSSLPPPLSPSIFLFNLSSIWFNVYVYQRRERIELKTDNKNCKCHDIDLLFLSFVCFVLWMFLFKESSITHITHTNIYKYLNSNQTLQTHRHIWKRRNNSTKSNVVNSTKWHSHNQIKF